MTSLPLHPALVHLPIGVAVLLPMLGAAVTLGVVRGWLPRTSWFLVVLVTAVGLASGLSAKRSGEQEEDRVEKRAEKKIPHEAIHEHEEAAEALIIAFAVSLVAATGVLFLRNDRGYKLGFVIVSLGFCVVAAAAYRTGELGGELVYRHGAGAP
jgi:uncharacterized membrane protein